MHSFLIISVVYALYIAVYSYKEFIPPRLEVETGRIVLVLVSDILSIVGTVGMVLSILE